MSTGTRNGHGLAVDAPAALAVLGYSALLNRVIPPRAHVAANLAAAGTAVVAVRALGATWDELGLSTSRVGRGVRAGVAMAAPIVGGAACFATLPQTRGRFEHPRVASAPRPLYEVMLRIPVGTALCEELIFRSALLACFERQHGATAAIAATSAIFGLWHVLPTLDGLDHEREPVDNGARAAAVAKSVLATTVAGLAFAWTRRRSDSVLSAVIVHTAINAAGFIAVRVRQRAGRQ
jgi:membrane protease YdiL (CAAX protease family)